MARTDDGNIKFSGGVTSHNIASFAWK
jgi:hypothetical protein